VEQEVGTGQNVTSLNISTFTALAEKNWCGQIFTVSRNVHPEIFIQSDIVTKPPTGGGMLIFLSNSK
jgi:hypothetical protein